MYLMKSPHPQYHGCDLGLTHNHEIPILLPTKSEFLSSIIDNKEFIGRIKRRYIMIKAIFKGHNLCRSGYLLFFCVLPFLAASTPATAQEATFPMSEDYLPSGKISEYLGDALNYLDRNRSGKFAPRVAFDLLMVANYISNRALSDVMKAFILFEHSQSLQSYYVLSSFKDVEDFREFLAKQADTRFKDYPTSFPRQFTYAVINGLRHFGSKLLENRSFLLRAYCFADLAGEKQIVNTILPMLRKESSDSTALASIINIYFDKELSATEKIVRLHGKGDDADFLEQLYLSRVSEEEKKQPDIIKILADNAIRSQEYQEAQLLIESMPKELHEDPQILFWKGWTLFSLEKDQQALNALAEITEKHQESEWATAAKEYAKGIRNYSEYQNANAEAILAMSKVIKAGIGMLQMNVNYVRGEETAKSHNYRAYVGIVPGENRLEASLYKDNNLFFGYRTTARNSAIYLKSEPKILAFRKQGPIPAPSLSLAREDNGTFTFEAGFAMESSMEGAGAKSSTLFNSPYLSTPEGVQTLLNYMTKRWGCVPNEPVTKNGITTFVWNIPSTDSPDIKQVEYRVSVTDVLTCVRYDKVGIADIKYGPEKSFQLDTPAWPKRPIEENEEFDFAAMMKLIGFAMEILKTEQ